MGDKIVQFEQMKQFTKDPNVLIIDVREPDEIKNTGKIDNSINIPLATVEDVLKDLSADNFKEKFGRDKPDENFHLVFSCKLGGRAAKAMDTAAELGYKNVQFYKGSWSEWEQKIKE